MLSLFWFVLYLMDRLIHVKNDVQLSTPRGFYTTFRNLSDGSFLFSTTSPTSLTSSLSSSHFKSTQPTLATTLAEENVLDAFKLMNFHRSKMNEYLCDDFTTAAKITPMIDRFLDSNTYKRNMMAELIRDVGSNSYKTWLMRTINKNNKSEQRNSIQRQDDLRFGYEKGHYKKPFYKIRGDSSNNLAYRNNYDNPVEDEDIYFGTSLPAYHVNRYKEASYLTRNQTSAIPITLSTLRKRKHPIQLIPNENIIGVNFHRKYVKMTENYRKNFKNNVTPRDTIHRSDASSNKDTTAIYVTQNNLPSIGQVITDSNTAYWTSENNAEFSNFNGSLIQGNNVDSIQVNLQIPPPDTSDSGASFDGWIHNNSVPYTQFYPSLMESLREYAYPPYYPPSDVVNGNNAQAYGYPGSNIDATSVTIASVPPAQFPPKFSYQAPVTSTLYGYQPSITSWPYGWVSTTTTTTTTTQKPMVIGWMPMTTSDPATINTPPSSSTTPPMMAMVPTPPPPAVPTMPSSFTAVPIIPVHGFPPSIPPSISTPLSSPYGYQLWGPPRPPWMGWIPSTPTPTPLPYGIDYAFNPPHNQNPNFSAGNSPPWVHFTDEFSDDVPQTDDEFNAAQLGNEFSNAVFADQSDYDSMQDIQDLQELQNLQDPRDNVISNILGPDAYELILTAIAFMAFGTYFMNTMLQLMQGNSSPTMMIIGNGGNTPIPPGSNFDETRKFSNHDKLGLLDEILILIDEFHDWLYCNKIE